jgi:hypothetical protein
MSTHTTMLQNHVARRLQIKNAIKRRAVDTDETAQQIISTAVTNCSEAAAAQLPPLHHIKRGIQRVKKDAGNPIPIPQNLQTMEISEEYTVTHRDEPFLLYDSGIDSPARIPGTHLLHRNQPQGSNYNNRPLVCRWYL